MINSLTASPASIRTTSPSAATAKKAPVVYDADQTGIDQDSFVKLAHDSGYDTEVQGSMDENKRLPFMLNPKPVVVTAKVGDQLVGVAKGLNLGEYAYLDTMMIDKPFQSKGVGTELLRQFQSKVAEQCGGPTSIATMSEDHQDTTTASHKFYLNRGFKPLPNALFLERGSTVKSGAASE